MMVHKALSIQVKAAWEAAVKHFHIIHGLKIMVDGIWEYSAWIKHLEIVSPVNFTLVSIQVHVSFLFFITGIVTSAFQDLEHLCVPFICTCGWKSDGEGLRNFSFRAPTGSSSFLFSTLLDQRQGRGLRTRVSVDICTNYKTPVSYL